LRDAGGESYAVTCKLIAQQGCVPRTVRHPNVA